MQKLDKFYYDVLRSCQGSKKMRPASEVFLSAVRNYDSSLEELANDLVSYWEENYSSSTPEETAEFVYKLFCFITGEFEDDQDFSPDEWQILYDSVIAAEDELDIELLQNYFSIFLERGIM